MCDEAAKAVPRVSSKTVGLHDKKRSLIGGVGKLGCTSLSARLRAELEDSLAGAEATHTKAEAARAKAKAEKVKAEKVAWKEAAEARLRAKLEAAHAEAEKQVTAAAEVARMHAEAARGQAQLLEKMNELKAELEGITTNLEIKNGEQTGCADACIIF